MAQLAKTWCLFYYLIFKKHFINRKEYSAKEVFYKIMDHKVEKVCDGYPIKALHGGIAPSVIGD